MKNRPPLRLPDDYYAPMTTNEAAERLRETLVLIGADPQGLDAALAAERRATVERLLTNARYAADRGNNISLSDLNELGRRILEEAARC